LRILFSFEGCIRFLHAATTQTARGFTIQRSSICISTPCALK
jgi:hypothetical protein